VLRALGHDGAWIVHGEGGYDEITTLGPVKVACLEGGQIVQGEIDGQALGLPRASPEDLQGGDAQENAKAIRALFSGQRGPFRDSVALSTAALLMVAGRISGLDEGLRLAEQALDSGEAGRRLERLITLTHEPRG